MRAWIFISITLFLFALLSGTVAAEKTTDKIWIVYYSDTGNSGYASEELQKKTGTDLYAVETVRTYFKHDPAVIKEPGSELETGDLPALKKAAVGWAFSAPRYECK